MNLVHLLLRSARWQPDRPALAIGKRSVRTYREMASRVAKLASGLGNQFKLKKHDRVALAMKNCPEFYEILFACWHAGITAVPMNAKLHPKEFAYILENSGAKLCFVTPDLQPAVPSGIAVEDAMGETECSPVDIEPDDTELISAWLEGQVHRPVGDGRPGYRIIDSVKQNRFHVHGRKAGDGGEAVANDDR